MKIALHVDRLVLDGALLDGERAGDVQAALERELARQLARFRNVDTLRRIGAVERLPVLALPAADRQHRSLGQRIAAAVGSALGPPRMATHRPPVRPTSGGHP